MTLKKSHIVYLLFILVSIINAQDKIVIVGDSFTGRKLGEYTLREFNGNVVMTQNNIKVTCDRAIQNITLDQVDLIGNVILTQDTVKLFTDRGLYFGKEGKAFSPKKLKMIDGNSILEADSGYYFVDEKFAHFTGNVKLQDSVKTLNSSELFYFEEKDSMIANGNVVVADSNTIIYSDTLIHLSSNDFSHALGNTKITNEKQSLNIYSNELFNYGDEKRTLLTGRPLLIKIDTTSTGRDTLFLSSNAMESFYDTSTVLIAKDSVLIKRGNFSSVNDLTKYYRYENKLTTFKLDDESPQPILWYDNSQLTGDSVYIFIKENSLDSISVSGNAILISKNKNFEFRYDQISGHKIALKFENGKLNKTIVNQNVLSIYYLYEDEEPNGLIKSSAKNAEIIFENNKVIKVNMSGTPASEYHPEKLVQGKEKEFTLPFFKIYNLRPVKSQVIGNRKIY